MKALALRILAIRGFGPLRRLLYRFAVAKNPLSNFSVRFAMRRRARGLSKWRPVAVWNRTDLVSIATESQSTAIHHYVFSLLLGRQNFVSALSVLDLSPRDAYSRMTQLEAIRAGYSAVKGELSDSLLVEMFAQNEGSISQWPAREFRAVCDSLRFSAFPTPQKLAMLEAIKPKDTAGPRMVAWLGAFVEVRRKDGLEFDASTVIDAVMGKESLTDLDIDLLRSVWAVARETISRDDTAQLMKRALTSQGVTVRNVPFLLRELSDDDIRSVTTDFELFRRLADFPQALNTRTYTPNGGVAKNVLDYAVAHWFGRSAIRRGTLFSRSTPEIKNLVVGILCRSDRWHLLPDMSELAPLSDTHLDARFARGLNHLLADEHEAASSVFEEILRENPDHKQSWLGLQWSSVRAFGDLGRIEDLRAEIGRGKSSNGRPVVDQISAEETAVTSRMWRGDFRRSPLSKVRPAWQAVAEAFGYRFVDFDRPLKANTTQDLLIIPINGVSDEVRDAYHYGELSALFRTVTIICDPRLTEIFRRSFPNVTFVPFARRDKPMHLDDRRDDPILGVPTVLANFVPNSLHDLVVAKSTTMTTGRNLSTQRLLKGELDLRQGGYLQTEPRLGTGSSKPRVGILWRSHVTPGLRGLMYLRLDEIKELFAIEGVEFVSLQHNATEEELETLKAHGVIIPDVDLFNDFDGIAQLVASLDRVVGISTLPTELAAAVGTPVWLLGFSPENLFLRTLGGQRSMDVLTANSELIAPRIDSFREERQVAVSETVREAARRITDLATRPAR